MNLKERIKELEYENRILKTTFCTCGYCKHADLYIPAYTYPFFDPRCKINGEAIGFNQKACEDFELIGRKSR